MKTRFDPEEWICAIQEDICAGKSAPSPPAAPDPNVVSAAQTASNEATARTQAALNRVDQYTPWGSSTFTNSGDKYTQTTTLPPELQTALDSQNKFTSGTYGLANDQLGRISSNLSSPVDYSGLPAAPVASDAARQQISDALYGRQTQYLDPQFANQKHDLDTQLATSGIPIGSDAWQRAQDEFGRQKTQAYGDARDSAITAGGAEQSRLFGLGTTQRQNAIQEYMAQREAPLNEASALLGGSQVQSPQFSQVPQTGVSPTDVTGAFGLNQAAKNVGYQGQVAQATSGNQAVAGLGGAALTAAILAGM